MESRSVAKFWTTELISHKCCILLPWCQVEGTYESAWAVLSSLLPPLASMAMQDEAQLSKVRAIEERN